MSAVACRQAFACIETAIRLLALAEGDLWALHFVEVQLDLADGWLEFGWEAVSK